MPRRHRAVSEVISSLIILLVVSVLGTFLYSNALTIMGNQENFLKRDLRIEVGKAQERVRVVSAIGSVSLDTLNITFLNYGKLDVKIVDIYVESVRVTSYITGREDEILTQDLGTVSFTSPVPFVDGANYDLVIVSERGVTYAYSWKS
jgi:archaellum component FlaF (FlaF/FlaG flagellin family)